MSEGHSSQSFQVGSYSSRLPFSYYQSDIRTRITIAPSVAPIIGGALAAGPGWRWIFWFLNIVSGACLVALVLFLPETNRVLVGNGSIKPPELSQPLIRGIMRPWVTNHNPTIPVERRKLRVPNPINSLLMLRHKDMALIIVAGSILYMVYCCIHTSLSSTFIEVYSLNQLQAGLIYLPLGIGGILATILSGILIDHDYRVTAKAHGLPTNKVTGDDLQHFPIEQARMRSIFVPSGFALISVITYGWLVDKKIVISVLAFASCAFKADTS